MKALAAATIVLSLLMAPPADALAHSGSTNAAGCHTKRKSGDGLHRVDLRARIQMDDRELS